MGKTIPFKEMNYNLVYMAKIKIGPLPVETNRGWNKIMEILSERITGSIAVPPKAWDDEPYLGDNFLLYSINLAKHLIENGRIKAILNYSDLEPCLDAINKRKNKEHSAMANNLRKHIFRHVNTCYVLEGYSFNFDPNRDDVEDFFDNAKFTPIIYEDDVFDGLVCLHIKRDALSGKEKSHEDQNTKHITHWALNNQISSSQYSDSANNKSFLHKLLKKISKNKKA